MKNSTINAMGKKTKNVFKKLAAKVHRYERELKKQRP